MKDAHRHDERGQAMVEFIVVMVPLFLLILGTIQFALIYQAKLTLNYAAFETARAGALTGARMFFMENAFARGMAPLYTNPFWSQSGGMDNCTNTYVLDIDDESLDFGPAREALKLNIDHAECGRARVRQKISNGEVRIVLVNPSPESFMDFGEPFDLVREYDNSGDAHLSAARAIPNDNLMYRSAAVGEKSGQTVQDANLIKVHTSFCYELIVPLVGGVITELMTLGPAPSGDAAERIGAGVYNRWGFGPLPGGTFGAACAANGGIPLYAQSVMRMHSAAVEETSNCRGRCP